MRRMTGRSVKPIDRHEASFVDNIKDFIITKITLGMDLKLKHFIESVRYKDQFKPALANYLIKFYGLPSDLKIKEAIDTIKLGGESQYNIRCYSKSFKELGLGDMIPSEPLVKSPADAAKKGENLPKFKGRKPLITI